jgi:hypothetical protein
MNLKAVLKKAEACYRAAVRIDLRRFEPSHKRDLERLARASLLNTKTLIKRIRELEDERS